MLLWFLRLFPQFKELEARAQALAARIEKSDSAIEAEEEKTNAWRQKTRDAEVQTHSLSLDIDSLREANQELMHEKALLQDRLASAIDDKDRLWTLTQEALTSERGALRMQVNHAIQRSGGGIPYPDVHSLPQNSVPRPQEPGVIGRHARRLPSEDIAIQTAQNIRTFLDKREASQQVSPL